MPSIDRTREALERLEHLHDQRVVFISDGTNGSEKVGHALASFRIIVPALTELLTDYMSALTLAQAVGKELPDSPMEHLIEAVLTVPRSQSPERLAQLLGRISSLD